MNTRKPEARVIDGYEVTTTKLRPTAALRLAPKILRILTPALATMQGVSLSSPDGVERIMTVLDTLDEDTLNMLYRDLLPETSIVMPDDNGVMRVVELNTPQMVDIAFGGLDDGLQMLVKVLIFVGEVNFKRSFFDLVAQLRQMGERAKTTATVSA